MIKSMKLYYGIMIFCSCVASVNAFTITDITPNIGDTLGGLPVTITGSNFVNGATVTINGSPLSGIAVTATSISGVTPVLPEGTHDLVVINPDTQSVTLANAFVVTPSPEFLAGDLAPRGLPDGQLNVADLVIMQRFIAQLETPSAQEFLVANVAPLSNPDNQLNVADFLILQRAILGIITLGSVIDNQGPQISIVLPLNNSRTSSSEVSIVGLLNESGTLTINDLQVTVDANFYFSYDTNLSEGLNTFTLIATDIYGNTNTEILTAIKDTLPPSPINVGALTVNEALGQVEIVGLVNSVEPNSTVNITINGVTISVIADGNGSFTETLDANNGDVIEFTVQDELGYISPIINYVVGADFQILNPADNSNVNTINVNIVGVFPSEGHSNEGVGINNTPSCIYNNKFYLNNYSLVNGTQLLTVTHSKRSGDKQVIDTSITRSGSGDDLLSADNYCGSAPLSVNFKISNINAYQNLYIDFDNDGVIDYNSDIEGSDMNFNYISEGVYPATAWFVFSDGTQKQSVLNIVVKSENNQDEIFKAIWNDMKSALLIGNVNEALQFITDDSMSIYRPVFELLIQNIDSVVGEFSKIEKVNEYSEVADYAIFRVEEGKIQTYFINYSKGNDGIWRVDSM